MSTVPALDSPGETRRGRPRNESCTADILAATIEVVAEVGIASLTMDAVAARAGVGKATIYRRWASKEALLLDAWTSAVQPWDPPDTGSLRDDVLVLLGNRPVADSTLQRVYPQMIAAAKVNPDVADAYREFVARRREPMRLVLERAAARGEIAPGVDLAVVHDLLVAPLLYRWLITDAPIDDAVVRQIVDVVVAGVTVAGVTAR